MKIAAAYENGMIAEQFESAAAFKLYTIENDCITSSEVCPVDGSDPIGLLKSKGVGILLCRKIAPASNSALMLSGTAVFSGMSGDADMQAGILFMGMTGGAQDASVSAALHSCGDMTCTGECATCSAGK